MNESSRKRKKRVNLKKMIREIMSKERILGSDAWMLVKPKGFVRI